MRTGTLSSAWTPDTWYTRNPQTCPSQTLQVSSPEQQPHPPGPFQAGCPHKRRGSGVTQAGLFPRSRQSCCGYSAMEISAVTKMIPLSRHDSLYLHKETLFPQLLFLPCEDPQRPQRTFGQSRTCLVHPQREHPEHWPWGAAAAKEAAGTAQKECCHLWHQPSCTGARATWQESFHGGMAVPSSSCPAHSHQPPPSPLISCFSNNPSPLTLAAHLVYTSLNQQQNLQAAPAITTLVTILHSVWAPLGGKLQETDCLLQEISTSHISHGEGLILPGLLVLLPEYH